MIKSTHTSSPKVQSGTLLEDVRYINVCSVRPTRILQEGGYNSNHRVITSSSISNDQLQDHHFLYL